MKVILSSNTYRDRGLKAALEAQGYRVETLASVSKLENGEIEFA